MDKDGDGKVSADEWEKFAASLKQVAALTGAIFVIESVGRGKHSTGFEWSTSELTAYKRAHCEDIG